MSVVNSRNDDALVSNYIIGHLRYHLMCHWIKARNKELGAESVIYAPAEHLGSFSGIRRWMEQHERRCVHEWMEHRVLGFYWQPGRWRGWESAHQMQIWVIYVCLSPFKTDPNTKTFICLLSPVNGTKKEKNNSDFSARTFSPFRLVPFLLNGLQGFYFCC